jgi:hypothetical protein
LQRTLYAQPVDVKNNLGALKLLTDRAIQGFQNNSTAYSISQLLMAYDVLTKLANDGGTNIIPGGTNSISFLLGDTIKLLTLNSNSAARSVTISYLNALEEQVTHYLTLGYSHSGNNRNQSIRNETLVEYANKPYGIKIDYPLTWVIRIDINYSLPTSSTYLHPHVIGSFYLPNATGGLPFIYVGINSDLSKQFKQPHFTVEQYLKKAIESKKNSSSFPDFKLIQMEDSNNSNTTLAGNPAYKIVWEYKHPQYGLREITEFGTVLNGTKGYFMDYAASSSTFSKYLPIADRVKSSFALLEANYQNKGDLVNRTRSDSDNVIRVAIDCHILCH